MKPENSSKGNPYTYRGIVRERSIHTMSSEKNIQNVADTTATAGAENPPALVKKIGRTTYIVRIHFSETSTETMSDKIKRMLKNEIQQM